MIKLCTKFYRNRSIRGWREKSIRNDFFPPSLNHSYRNGCWQHASDHSYRNGLVKGKIDSKRFFSTITKPFIQEWLLATCQRPFIQEWLLTPSQQLSIQSKQAVITKPNISKHWERRGTEKCPYLKTHIFATNCMYFVFFGTLLLFFNVYNGTKWRIHENDDFWRWTRRETGVKNPFFRYNLVFNYFLKRYCRFFVCITVKSI